MPTISVYAPFAGVLLPLAAVPDPVFAQALAGDGVALEPLSNLVLAPCAGTARFVGGKCHAIAIEAEGLTVLVHVGIDTVALNGDGFETLVADGAEVAAGAPLLRFDLDAIARRVPSLITPVLLTEPTGAKIIRRREPGPVSAADWLFEASAVAADEGTGSMVALRASFTVPFDHGLHARPAAQVLAALAPFAARVMLHQGPLAADARSITALMTLGATRGSVVHAEARGADADAALEALSHVLVAYVPAATRTPPAPVAPVAPGSRLSGTIAAPGMAAGVAVRLDTVAALVPADAAVGDPRELLDQAMASVARHLEAAAAGRGGTGAEVLQAHRGMLDDPALAGLVDAALRRGAGATEAISAAIAALSGRLEATGDARMRGRIADLRDIERQVLHALAGRDPGAAPELPERAIVLADDLLPSELLALNRTRLAGVCLARGGTSSHVAIIAASLDLPLLVAAGPDLLGVAAGTDLVLDGDEGVLHVSPQARDREALEAAITARADRLAAARAAAGTPAVTTDGVRVHVLANVASTDDALAAVAGGAEGCGLLRSEFLFLDRSTAPSCDEQRAAYQAIANAFGGLPVTIRTLDAGGDKPLPYVTQPVEENPALGLRGIRADVLDPDLLESQLSAIAATTGAGCCRVMVPMVTDLTDVRSLRQRLGTAAAAGGHAPPAFGIMIETPSAALLTDQLAAHVDFFSIGSNDLAQYTLAMDRQQPSLAARLDALHPAVLRLIRLVVASAGTVPVGVCGALASDRTATPVLVGLGIRELSATPATVALVKQRVRGLDLAACRSLATEACTLVDAAAVRALVTRRFGTDG